MSVRKYIDDMTPERILSLARRPDGFSLSRYRWRDEPIAARCKKLVEEGKLRVSQRDRDSVVYKPQDSAGSETKD